MILSIELPMPPALNHAYRASVSRNGRPYTYKSTKAKRWQSDAQLIINASRKVKKTYEGQVGVTINLYLKHDRDIDSSFKLLLDTLENSGVIKNDRQIGSLIAHKHTLGKCKWCGLHHEYDDDIVKVDVISLGTTL
jgi:Holliday junction resolvase RusA-like endonuclease